ncbi:hypothetical protein BDR26DRAFT_871926 [Obelidium mucronatum]|nr:hypothetical protein BDR26DRAFT_871926 [Obelidium mucronatum]
MVAHLRKKVWEATKDSLFKSTVASQLKVFANKNEIVDSANSLEADALVGDRGKSADLPLLVLVPKTAPRRSLQSRFADANVRWKDENPLVDSLDFGLLSFENRTDTIKQLQQIHRSNFYRAVNRHGANWVIPIADNVHGLGKSALGYHYIHKSRETWPDPTARDAFQQNICNCHTVSIGFQKKDLLSNCFDAVIIEHLCYALKDMFVVPPAILSNPPKSVKEFLEDLTEVAGPVFIVLDSIGKALVSPINPLDDFQQRDKFMIFCESVLDSWLTIPKVFFVVLGRARFLNHVVCEDFNRSYEFERLHMSLLRPSSIISVMNNTLVSSRGIDTISSRLGLTQQNAEFAAEHLFRQTNGHPRALVQALENCRTFTEICEYNDPYTIPDWETWYDRLTLNKIEATELLRDAEPGVEVDLTATVIVAGGETMSRDNFAHMMFFDWEGTLTKAQLYIQPTVKEFAENYVLSFKEYLKHVGNNCRVSVDYSSAFEWLFLRRFQELFAEEPKDPLVALPDLGSYKAVSFSKLIKPIPKITSLVSSKNHVHPDHCGTVLEWRGRPICLKPPLKECLVFDRMAERDPCRRRSYVLFICCTRYESDIMEKFNGQGFYVYKNDAYQNIGEVVLLNLSDKNLRERFFDVEGDLSAILEHIVGKSKVEYQEFI